MAEREIDAVFDTYEDQHQKSNEHNPVKVLHQYHQLLLILAFGTSVFLQAVLLSRGMMGFQTALADFSKLVSFMGLMNSIVCMCSRKSKLAGLETYFGAFALVLEDYVLLTTLNKRYIEMIIIPIMIFCFIAAIGYSLGVQPKLATQNEYQSGEISSEEEKQSKYLHDEEMSLVKTLQREYQSEGILLKKDRQSENQSEEVIQEEDIQSEYQNEDVLSEKGTQREHQNEEILSEKDTQSEYQNESEEPIQEDTQWELIQIAMVPYFMQLSLGVWIQYKGQLEDGIFIVSNFVLFFSSALCALTVMMASPPIGLTPGVVAQVLPVMHKTCIIMLMMTGHTMAAEWLREDIVFVCMPELAAVLAWFTIYFLHPDHGVGIKVATSHGSGVIILGSVGAILASLAAFYAEDRIILTSWLRRVLCISSSSSALCFLHQWLLNQWPANTPDSTSFSKRRKTPDSTGLDQLLKFSSEISLYVAVSMLCFRYI